MPHLTSLLDSTAICQALLGATVQLVNVKEFVALIKHQPEIHFNREYHHIAT